MNVLSTEYVAVIGMGIVLVLIILWGVLEAMRLISTKENKKKKLSLQQLKNCQVESLQDTEDRRNCLCNLAAVAAMLQQPSYTFKLNHKRSPTIP